MSSNDQCTISLIVAVAENGVIGADNAIPWKCQTDMRYFRELTMGKPVIMGRKTWESLKKPLVGRDNIVITSDEFYRAEGGEAVHSVEAALALARAYAAEAEECEIMVIGGSTVYAELLDAVDRIYLTLVHLKPEGDSFFWSLDDLEARGFRQVSKVDRKAGQGDDADLTFYRFER
jgi:dihydrofolate reductase